MWARAADERWENPLENQRKAHVSISSFTPDPRWERPAASSNSASSSTVIGAKASGSQCTRPFSNPATRAGRTGEVSWREVRHWLVVPADNDHVTLFDPIKNTREVGIGLLNVDSYHAWV